MNRKVLYCLVTLLTIIFIPSYGKAQENLSTKEYNWYISFNKNIPPFPPKEINNYLEKYDVHFLGDTSKKVLYLTFDEGYENGYTEIILDILKKNNVKAAFFVVKPYILSNKSIVERMYKEGHLVCNHSSSHPSMAKITQTSSFTKEFTDVEEAYKEVTGKDMIKLFRPPMGKYSELSLSKTRDLGYKTIFWSFAYMDWLINKQPTKTYALDKIIKRTHPGEIVLLHAVSKTNAEILDEVISTWHKMGYTIDPLDKIK